MWRALPVVYHEVRPRGKGGDAEAVVISVLRHTVHHSCLMDIASLWQATPPLRDGDPRAH